MTAAAMGDGDTSVVMAGQTYGNFSGASISGSADIVVVKLNATSGTEIWRYQV